MIIKNRIFIAFFIAKGQKQISSIRYYCSNNQFKISISYMYEERIKIIRSLNL